MKDHEARVGVKVVFDVLSDDLDSVRGQMDDLEAIIYALAEHLDLDISRVTEKYRIRKAK